MSNASSVQSESSTQTISRLILISDLDTLYRDIYMQRARELMETIMSNSTYSNIKNNLAALGLVERQLKGAIERGDWKRTTELTERVREIRSSAERKDAVELAATVYDKLAEVPIDPFSPGFYAFFGRSADTLHDWRSRAINSLSVLERTDPSNANFYARRQADFQALKIDVGTDQKKETEAAATSALDLRQEALKAIDSGDLSQLDNLLKKLAQKPAETEKKEEKKTEVKLAETAELGDDLNFTFSEATLAAAKSFGLGAARTSSRRQFAYLLPYGWQPSFQEGDSKRWARDQFAHLTHSFEKGDKQRDAVEFFLFNPFINSGGTRYQVCLVEEDLLVEDFPEPDKRTDMTPAELLVELGLDSRWGLSRIEIENALLTNGPRFLKEKLQLNPQDFRLVAIPPDIYGILGAEHGWGQKEMWTHFDGYWVREGGSLNALAGGDRRFGGTHDVISFQPNYTKEMLLARFAVVQRKRLMTWHRK